MAGPSDCAGPARPVPFVCQCCWLRLCREPEPMGTPKGRCLAGYPQVLRYPTAANGPLTGPLTANGRIASRPLTVSGVADRHRGETHEAPALFQ